MRRFFTSRKLLAAAGVAVVLGIVIAAIFFVRMLRYGFSAHDEPTAIEAFAARQMRRWSAPADLRQAPNPLPLTPEVLAEARAHFADHCASCHGNDGKGDTEIGRHLYPKAPDMTLAETQSLSDGELFSAIENGIRLTGMPGWGDGTAESAYGSWTLVHFIRHLPKLTPEDLEGMRKMNPVSPAELQQRQSDEDFLEGNDGEDGKSPTS